MVRYNREIFAEPVTILQVEDVNTDVNTHVNTLVNNDVKQPTLKLNIQKPNSSTQVCRWRNKVQTRA